MNGEALLPRLVHASCEALSIHGRRRGPFTQQIGIGVRQLLEEKRGGPQGPFQLSFLGLEEAADRITMVDLTAIEEMAVWPLAFESQDAATVWA